MLHSDRLTIFQARKDFLLLALAAFFLTNAVVAEVVGGKLIHVCWFSLNWRTSAGALRTRIIG